MARWLILALALAVLGDVAPATAAEPRLPRNWRFALPPGTAVRECFDLVEFLKGIR